MPAYRVEVLSMVARMVDVEAETPEEAADKVQLAASEVPPIESGSVLEGWEYVVYHENGIHELYRTED
jgi:hypothetical protein